MTRDKTKALTEIRALCNEYIDAEWPRPSLGDLRKPTRSENLLARIEWICRHALEDYDTPDVVEVKENGE